MASKSVTLKTSTSGRQKAAKPSKKDTVQDDAGIAVPTIIHVSKSVKVDGSDEAAEVEQEETIEVHRFATTPAMVEFRYPIKRSKDYQSAGIEIGVTLPCYVEEIPEALEKAKQLVVARLQEEMPKLSKVLDKLCDLR